MKSVTIIGAGAVGRSIALALFYSGVTVSGVYSRSGRSAAAIGKKVHAKHVGTVKEFQWPSDVVIIAVPDADIQDVVKKISSVVGSMKGKTVFHTSGALTSDELSVLKRKGASIGSFHPLQTFSDSKRRTSMVNIWCAVEGDAAAIKISGTLARKLGSSIFEITKKQKGLYHASAVFASNYLVTLLSVVEEMAVTIHIPKKDIWKIYSPLILQTVQNVLNSSPRAALTGPIVRGDIITVMNHIKALSKPPLNHLVTLYSALGIETTRLVKKKYAR